MITGALIFVLIVLFISMFQAGKRASEEMSEALKRKIEGEVNDITRTG